MYLSVREWSDISRWGFVIAVHGLQVLLKIIIDYGKSCRNSIPCDK